MQQKIILLLFSLFYFTQAFAQIEIDTTKKAENPEQKLIIQTDTLIQSDTSLIVIDSAYIKRQEFIRDSLIAREKFIKDSLYRRKLILDSVRFLKLNLPKLIEAAVKSYEEEIIIYTEPIYIIGDSSLSNYIYRTLSQKIDKAYTPWKTVIKLSGNSFKIKVDTTNHKILYIGIPKISYALNYKNNKNVVVLTGRAGILRKASGNLYKVPIDSVFFDNSGRVKAVKKYERYYQANKNYQKGALLYTDIYTIKEYDYFSDGVLSNYKVINYCGRSTGKEKNEVCHTTTYSITREGNKFTVEKRNIPENVYSDGTYIFEFDENFDLKSMEFNNLVKSINRNCIVELNKEGNVSRYLYKKDGWVNKTLLINYNNNPDAKHKVERIACFFEDDGISYYQKNITTGKSRTRDKLTMKWSEWK